MIPIEVKTKAITLRKRGYSLNEISEKLHIAKSTASTWLSNINLSNVAKNRLEKKQILGQYKTMLIRKKLREKLNKERDKVALKLLSKIGESKELYKLCCALLWWCEGSKNSTSVRFTNSDPTLIKNFLTSIRLGFKLDESRFRAVIHIHSYHIDKKQKLFWSNITNIPLQQFWKSYRKPNTGKRRKNNYPGCISITYYNSKIARELEAIYNMYSKIRGVG